MSIPEVVVTCLTVSLCIPTLASITKFDQWWIRGFDFPRLQISFFILLLLLIVLFQFSFNTILHYIIVALLLVNFAYQAVKIYPYTILAKKQVLSSKENNPKTVLSILVSNVLTPNENYEKLIAHVHKFQPDLLLTLESDKKWENALSVIEQDYPFCVKIPQDNLYGMHLYSKLKLEDIEVKNLISDEIPSIHGFIKLGNGHKVKIHCLHPKPPSPTEDDTSTNRDAELLLVGEDVKEDKGSIIVFGDLNDVAWSRTTNLFQKISGLLDPRIGRGFFNTFNSKYPIFRWPLDHLFFSDDFTLIGLHRLKSIGSDHFPIFIKLNYEPEAEPLQEEPEEPNGEEKEWAREKIKDGKPKEEV
ncbi:MAG TPA: endonuclease/exonuclease/phosphatase family protein [Salinimicrobium sp.]|nr:endonuclease/exonuclease/phosphatase family protein [Salinimicrobium sp.]